jgi:GNAT superfamily N-acetyltransferase
MTEHVVRPYIAANDGDHLWALKSRFERELGTGGGSEKSHAYDAKLDEEYRRRYLAWVKRCVDGETCIFVADAQDGPRRLDGYIFMLPEQLAFVWDAAVINEIFVRSEYRDTGLADRLLIRGLEHARKQALPLDRVVLDVDRTNSRARAFYARHGFEHWGEMVAHPL